MATKKTAAITAAQKRAAELRAQEALRQRRNRVLIIVGSVVAVALLFGLISFIQREGRVPELGEEGSVAPAGSLSDGSIPVDAAGVAGKEAEAPVRIDIYSDFLCPICKEFEALQAADIAQLRADGKVAVYYHPISILDRLSSGTSYSTRAAAAAATVADLAPDKFIAFSEALFANQPAENSEGLSAAQIEDIAKGVGVPDDVASKLDDGTFIKWVRSATNASSLDGVTGTPTVIVNGIKLSPDEMFQPGMVKLIVEGIIDGSIPTVAPSPSPSS